MVEKEQERSLTVLKALCQAEQGRPRPVGSERPSIFDGNIARHLIRVEDVEGRAEKQSKTAAIVKKLAGLGGIPLDKMRSANVDNDNVNEEGFSVEDEWYAKDDEMHRAVSVLKMVLGVEKLPSMF